MERAPPVKPFKLCYHGAFVMMKRPASFDVPTIHIELPGVTGRNRTSWRVFNDNYLFYVEGAMCVGILEMEPSPSGVPVDAEPAMVIGSKMIRNNLLLLDLEKQVLGFSGLLDFRLSSCYGATMLS